MPSLLKNPLVWFGIVVVLAGLGVGIAAAAGAFKKKAPPPPPSPSPSKPVPGQVVSDVFIPGIVFLGSLSQSVSQASTVIVPIQLNTVSCPKNCKTMVEATWTYTDSTHKTGSYRVTNPTITDGIMTINYARNDGGLSNACIMTVKAWQENAAGVSGSPTSVWGFFT